MKARFRADGQGGTQRVEAEHRIGSGNQGDRGDRILRDQVPVHDIAEWLVYSHTIDEYRQTLRCAEQRGRGEPAKIDVRLKRVVLAVIERDAAQVIVQILGKVLRFLSLDLGPGRGLDVCRNLADWNADALHRCGADYLDGRRFQFGCRIFCGTGLTEHARQRDRDSNISPAFWAHVNEHLVLIPFFLCFVTGW